MIDWGKSQIEVVHKPIKDGHVMKVSEDGSVDWSTPCRKGVRGSYESDYQVRSLDADGNGNATILEIDGNPSKFLQGHNAFGSDDYKALMYDASLKIFQSLGITPTIEELRNIKNGEYRNTRIDINYPYQLPCNSDVNAWIRSSEFKSKTRHGRPSSKGGTVYWGKSSSRWSLKAYNKFEELNRPKNGLSKYLKDSPILDWSQGILRIELTLRGKELDKIGLSRGRDWNEETVRNIYMKYLGTLEMSEQMVLSDEIVMNLPKNLKATYALWSSGFYMRDTLSKATYYRHRRDLLEHGINIDLTKETTSSSNVIPLIKILEAKQVSIPDWAFDLKLVHNSAR